MDLQQLASNLQQQIQTNGTLTLTPRLIPSNRFPFLLQMLSLQNMVFTLTPADITVKDNILSVSGKVNLYNQDNDGILQLINTRGEILETVLDSILNNLSIPQLSQMGLLPLNRLADPTIFPTIAFPGIQLNASSVTYAMTLSVLSSNIDFPIIPGAGGLSLKDFGFAVLTYVNPVNNQRTPNLTITGVFRIGKTDLSISLAVPINNNMPANQWSLTFSTQQTLLGGIYDILGLFPGMNVLGSMPPDVAVLSNFGITQLSILFNPSIQKIYDVTVIISNPHPWQVASGFAIEQLRVTMQFNRVPAKPTFTLEIDGVFNMQMSSATANLEVHAHLPFGEDEWLLAFTAEVEIDKYNEFFIALPGLSGTQPPALPVDITFDSFNLNTLEITYNTTSRQISRINFDISTQVDIKFFNVLDIVDPAMALDIENPFSSADRTISGFISTQLNIVDIPLELRAEKADPSAGWTFKGAMLPDSSINIMKLVKTFLSSLGITNLPAWLDQASLNIEGVNVTVYTPAPEATDQKNKYSVGGTVKWQLNYQSFVLPKLTATLQMDYVNGNASGMITVEALLLGMNFKVGYKFGTPDTQVYLEWEGIVAQYQHDNGKNTDTITVVFGKMSLGEIITHLIASFEPGFTLAAPWNVLNSINLNGLSFVYVRNINDPSQSSLKVVYNSNVDLGFLQLSAITLTKDSTGVYLGFEGKFLGMTISSGNPETAPLAGKGSDVRNMPGVPGMGSQFFDLRFLGMGQHVAFTNPGNISDMQGAIDTMKKSFSDTNGQPNSVPIKPDKQGSLYFDQNSHWLFGADFTVAKFYKMALIFNDPELYGLLISIDPTAAYFANLYFEILYKKINDNIGMYQIDLQLPDVFRHLEFGEVSITLPNIGIKIYTNGNFYLDFGFPASITDFSRSFTVQVFPFTGSGGFYFGWLSGATATNIPKTTCGIFNPVIAFGLGLQLGVGKTIDEGILKAGLYLTAVGIFQGVIAVFHATPGLSGAKDDNYYKLQGTFGLVGHIYGEVNFAIISARVDILAYVYVSITIESYMEIPISFVAGVSVSLRITINLGLFKIHINLSFSATIRARFVIGSNHPQDAGWNGCLTGGNFPAYHRLGADLAVTLNWQPVSPDTGTNYLLDLYVIPQLTVSGEGATPGPQYNMIFYIDTASANIANTVNGLTALSTGVLYWCLSALVSNGRSSVPLSWLQTQQISTDQLQVLLCYFNTRPDNVAPFNYSNTAGHDVISFLKTFFSVQITATDPATQQELQAAIFPALPPLLMQTDYNGAKGAQVNFATQSMTGSNGYISAVSGILRTLSMDAENKLTADYYGNACTQVTDPDYQQQQDLSMPTVIFTDFIALVAKTFLQHALDYMQANKKTSLDAESLVNAVVTAANVTQTGSMSSRFLLYGLRLPAPPNAATGAITPLYQLTGQQFPLPAALKTGDTFSMNITKDAAATWISFNPGNAASLNITINNDEITRINDMRSVVLSPTLESGSPAAMVNYRDTPQAFTLNSPALWQYPGDYFAGVSGNPVLWLLPQNLTDVFALHAGISIPFSLQTIKPSGDGSEKGSISHLAWATTVPVTIQQISAGSAPDTPLAGNMYNLTGADDSGVVPLQQLIIFLNTTRKGDDSFIAQIQLLYEPDPTTDSAGGNISAANGALQLAIVQANLSTETNPTGTSSYLKDSVTNTYNTLNKPGIFLQLLWENSIVRSGGFYLYYRSSDGDGIPPYLFNKDGVARLTLVVTYTDLLIQPFVNSVVTGDQVDTSTTSVYAQTASITTRVATIPVGTVGYTVVRNNPGEYNPSQQPPTTADNQVYLQNQFNLLGTTLPGVAAYQNLLPAGPADTLDEDQVNKLRAGETPNLNTDYWNYAAVIPYYKYVQPSGTDPDYPNPYGGIGATVQMQLNWQDMFGNIPMNNVQPLTLSMASLYTDPLIAISQWPAVSSYYQFAQNAGKPEIQLSFCFDKTKYTGSKSQNNAAIDLETYMRLYYQLVVCTDVNMSFRSSIDGSTAVPEGSTRSINIAALNTSFLTPVISYLKSIVAATTIDSNSILYTISSPVDTATIASYADILPLTLTATVQRTSHIDPAFANTAGISSAQTTVPPQSKGTPCGNGNDDSLSLTPFAQQFEAAFKDQPTAGITLKLATGTPKESEDKIPSLWMIRLDSNGKSGINFNFSHAAVYFFAPVPLANNLLSFSSNNYPYASGQPYPAGAAVTQHFSSIDLDNWGLQFLTAVDSFLSPAYAVPAFLLDNGVSLASLLAEKENIANAIEGTIDYIIDPGSTPQSNIGNAQDKWKQVILQLLSNAYRYTTAVQTPATINSGWTGSNNQPPEAPYVPALYGSMKGTDPSLPPGTPPNTSYSLSNAKVPLGNGQSWLTYMFESKDLPASRSFSFTDMRYAISHLEYQLQPVDGIEGYMASSWLTFIIPLDNSLGETGNITIPVPLRAYPTPPSILSQGLQYPVNSSSDPITIADTRAWNYRYVYQNQSAAQDTIHTQVQFNIPASSNTFLSRNLDESPTLDQALSQFMSVYPAMLDDFNMHLLTLTADDVTNNTPNAQAAKNAVAAFIKVVTVVAKAWSTWNQIHPRTKKLVSHGPLSLALSPYTLSYTITENKEPATNYLSITITKDSGNSVPMVPLVNISNYTAEPVTGQSNTWTYKDANGDYLLYADRNKDPDREVVMQQLDILHEQNSWSGASIIRNEYLIQNNNGTWQPTNQRFIYQTPWVRFFDKLVPLLHCNRAVDIATINSNVFPAPQQRTLQENMTQLFIALTNDVTLTDILIKLHVSYQYTKPGTSFIINLPVLLLASTEVSIADKGLAVAIMIADAMKKWKDTHMPETNKAQYNLDMTVFSDDSTRPVLQVQLYLLISGL